MQFVRAFGPAAARVPWTEAVRAGLGALVGLGVAGLFLLSPSIDLQQGLFLMAPFGASSVLLFAVPNSPLAQPWSAIAGNIVAAVVAITVCMLVHDPVLKVAVAVCAAIAAMILCRALHPPGGAVAMTAALNPELVDKLGYYYAIAPVGVGTCALVVIAIAYAYLTGRRYPFRQFDEASKHATHDRNPGERLGLSQDELADILSQYRQSFNLGVEDLARLIGAAEIQAAAHKTGPLSVGDIMSTDLISVAPDTPVTEVLDLFKRHRFTSLPVVSKDAEFVGVIFQIDVIDHFKNGLAAHMRGIASQAGRMFRVDTATAQTIMQNSVPQVGAGDSIGSLLPLMADGTVDAVPVLDGRRIIGIATRTDLVAGLTHMAARRGDAPCVG